jgi:hypothetical protein
VQFAEPGHELKIFFASLGKTETGIKDDLGFADTCLPCNLQRSFQEKELVGDHVRQPLAVASGVHDDEAGAGFGGQPRDVGFALQAVYIVDDMRAGRHGQACRFGPVGVDGH